MKEYEEIRITNLMKKYAKSMCNNIEARFPQTTCKIPGLFRIFDIALLPMSSSPSFCVYWKNELSFLPEREEFKFELIDIKKKYQLTKEILTDNDLKLK